MWLRVSALLLRYLYLYRRSPARVMGVVFWPVMDLLVWGFLTSYLKTVAVPGLFLYLIGAVIFWDVFYSSQQAITLSITEEIWVRNILNLFVAPIRVSELLLATCLVGVLRAAASALVLASLAYPFYAFNLLSVGFALLPFLFSLLLFGWAMGMFTMALILRFGQAAEALIWGIPFLIQPLSAVFYPVTVLPAWLRVVSRALPSTHVFEGMRSALASGIVDGSTLSRRDRPECDLPRSRRGLLRLDARAGAGEGIPLAPWDGVTQAGPSRQRSHARGAAGGCVRMWISVPPRSKRTSSMSWLIR